MSSKTQTFVTQESKFGADNYKPLDVVLSTGKGVWVKDVDGNRYMDMLSAYSALNQGHNHPKIIRAAQKQLTRLTLTSRAFRNDQFGPFLQTLTKISGRKKALPMNSGAEAVETALKVARKWGHQVKGVMKNKAEIIVCAGNFHGRTITIVGFSTEEQYQDGFGPFTPGFKIIPFGDSKALKKAITKNTVAFMVEPIQGEGGVIIPPKGYLAECAKICKKNNVLLIADEIQTGLGRTGAMFASDHENVKPDVIIVGKALSGGVSPVSAIVADKEVMDVFNPGDHGSTFGGNPFASAVATTALNVIVNEKLPQNSKKLGDYFINQLRRLNSPHIRDIRGKGLFIGVEVKESSGDARKFCELLQIQGILAKETHHTVVRFAPPLVITRSQIDWAMKRIAKVFA
jgi:ornithine--oxo-acid transaminase